MFNSSSSFEKSFRRLSLSSNSSSISISSFNLPFASSANFFARSLSLSALSFAAPLTFALSSNALAVSLYFSCNS
ncbi:hypothetical protein X975_21310, partial [Stegodyphus mimosarum]